MPLGVRCLLNSKVWYSQGSLDVGMKRLTLILLFLVCQNKPAGTFCRDGKINDSASEEDSIEEQFSLGKGFVGLWEVFGFLEKRVLLYPHVTPLWFW